MRQTIHSDAGQQLPLLVDHSPCTAPAALRAETIAPAVRAGEDAQVPTASAARVIDPTTIHPSLWRASQLARPVGRVVSSGILELDAELPGGGWAEGSVSELIVKHPGIGELSMLRGALDAAVQRNRPIWLVGCPYAPNGPELARIGLARHVRWVKQSRLPTHSGRARPSCGRMRWARLWHGCLARDQKGSGACRAS
ncbi:hypothetical protein ACUXAV_005921 [Cupriavidus metallidurans]